MSWSAAIRQWQGVALFLSLAAWLGGCASPAPPARPASAAWPGSPLKPEAERRAEAAARFATGLLYHDQGKTEQALAEFEQAARLDPADAELAVSVASELIRNKQVEKAIPILERSRQLNRQSASLLHLLGFAYQTVHQYEKAEKTFLQLLKEDPADIGAYQNLAATYLAQGRRQDAYRLLTQASRQRSDDERYWSALGELFARLAYEEPRPPTPATHPNVSSKRDSRPKGPPKTAAGGEKVNPLIGFARAQECYEKAAALAPESVPVLTRLADLCMINKQYDQAIGLYLKILELRPHSVNIREKLALGYVAQDDKKQAIAQIEELVKKEPLKFKYYLMLGELYLDAARSESDENAPPGTETEKQRLMNRALDKFQQAVVLNPNELDPQLSVAYIQLIQKKPDQALLTLDRAREKFPRHPKLYYFYGLTHSDLKQYEQAVQSFRKALDLSAEFPDQFFDSAFYFYYGAACERAGHIELAAEQFRKSIELNPHNAEAYNYLGYMWAEKGIRLEEALDFIQKALEFEPDNGAYVDSLGWVYFKLGRYDEALQHLLRAATLLKQPDPVVFDHIAEAYLQLGKKELAIQHWKKAIELDPTNTEIAEKLKKIEGGP